jgi:hypothetical protein
MPHLDTNTSTSQARKKLKVKSHFLNMNSKELFWTKLTILEELKHYNLTLL